MRPTTWWLARRLPPASLSSTLGDLDEEFELELRARGRLRAEWWWLTQARSVAAAYANRSADLRISARLASFVRDARLGLRDSRRRLRHSPGYALVAIGSLAVGVAAIVITLSLTDAILFQPINANAPNRVVRLTNRLAGGPDNFRFSFPELDVVTDHVRPTVEVTAAALTPALIRVDQATTQELVDVTLGDHLSALGLQATRGRLLTPDDHRPGAPRVVVLADHFWRAHFDTSRDVVGRSVALNNLSYTVVGVAPTVPSLGFFGTSAAGWVPAETADSLLNDGWRTTPDDRAFVALLFDQTETGAATASDAALRSSLERATEDLTTRLSDRWTDRDLATIEGLMVAGSLRGTATLVSTLLAGMAVLILVVATTNVGGLVYAQWTARRRATAIRTALGASRSAIVMHMLGEGATIGLAGGALALVFYLWFARTADTITLLPTVALQVRLPLDWTLSLATLALGTLAGVVMTMGPAMIAGRTGPMSSLGSGTGRQVSLAGTGRSRRLLLTAQLAASLVLVVLAAAFSRSLGAQQAQPLGVDIDHLAAFDFDIAPVTVPGANLSALVREAMTRVQRLPGVERVAMAERAPVDASTPSDTIRFADGNSDTVLPDVTRLQVTRDYFDTVGIALLQGRAFRDADAGRDLAIVNETLSRRLGTATTLVDEGSGRRLTVIGVVADSKYRSVTEAPQPHFYLPVEPQFHLAMLVRTQGEPRTAFGDVQRALDEAGPGIQGFFPRTGRDQLAPDLLTARTAATMARVLGGLATALAAIGLSGVLIWLVQARRSEFGLRLALGATPADLRGLVFRHAMRGAWPGLSIGMLAAALAIWTLRSQLHGLSALDPVLILVVPCVALALVLVSSWIPARRAARISPLELLR